MLDQVSDLILADESSISPLKPKKRSILKKSKNKPKSNDAHMDSFILKRPHSPTHSPKRKQRQLIESNATVVNESLLHPYYESLEQFDFSHPQPNHQQNLKNVEERIIRNIYMNGSHEELFQLLEGDSEANFIKNIDIKIDSLGHSALQWAGCLSNIPKVKWLISYNASSTHLNISGESTLMLVIGSIFSYQARSFKELLDIFQDAMYSCDLQHRTLWHHIVLSFSSLDCLDGSIYYANTLRDWLMNSESVAYNTMFANIEDCNGNTALHLAQKLNSNFLTELIVSCGGRLDDNQEILNEYQIEESLSLRVDHC